ncbi:MAG TPA: hypothetical protein VFJ16_26475 [Longimicrobium sp.]|nr:hypothetical protein [Longimicrobium sp.]
MEIDDLVGEVLNAVCFVMDYVELHFNGAVLRALSTPVVETAAGMLVFPEFGSRDALCSLIGAQVLSLDVSDDAQIRIRLAERGAVTIPLGSSPTGESAHFVPGWNQPIQVFT